MRAVLRECGIVPGILTYRNENAPFQIYWKFHHQKLKVSDKNADIFIFLL